MVVVSAFELVLDDHGPSARVLAEQVEIEPSDGMLNSTQGQRKTKRATETVQVLCAAKVRNDSLCPCRLAVTRSRTLKQTRRCPPAPLIASSFAMAWKTRYSIVSDASSTVSAQTCI